MPVGKGCCEVKEQERTFGKRNTKRRAVHHVADAAAFPWIKCLVLHGIAQSVGADARGNAVPRDEGHAITDLSVERDLLSNKENAASSIRDKDLRGANFRHG